MNPVTAFRLYLKVNAYWKQWTELTTMHLSTNVITQSIALILQGANQFGGFIPVKYQPVVALSLGALQSIGALIAHFSTPTGAKIVTGLTGESILVKQ